MATYEGRKVRVIGVVPDTLDQLHVYNTVLKEEQVVNRNSVVMSSEEEDKLSASDQKTLDYKKTSRAARLKEAAPAYVNTTTYASGDRVSFDGSNYTSSGAGNVGNSPSVTSTFWKKDAVITPPVTTPVVTTPVVKPTPVVTPPITTSPHQLRTM